jgi:hypothetical protein
VSGSSASETVPMPKTIRGARFTVVGRAAQIAALQHFNNVWTPRVGSAAIASQIRNTSLHPGRIQRRSYKGAIHIECLRMWMFAGFFLSLSSLFRPTATKNSQSRTASRGIKPGCERSSSSGQRPLSCSQLHSGSQAFNQGCFIKQFAQKADRSAIERPIALVFACSIQAAIFPSWRCFGLTGLRVAHRSKYLSQNRKFLSN